VGIYDGALKCSTHDNAHNKSSTDTFGQLGSPDPPDILRPPVHFPLSISRVNRNFDTIILRNSNINTQYPISNSQNWITGLIFCENNSHDRKSIFMCTRSSHILILLIQSKLYRADGDEPTREDIGGVLLRLRLRPRL